MIKVSKSVFPFSLETFKGSLLYILGLLCLLYFHFIADGGKRS